MKKNNKNNPETNSIDDKNSFAKLTETRETLNEEQRKALDIMIKGQDVFLTGKAGTGKSYLLSHFLNNAKSQGKNVIVCAPTGIAAIQVHGATLHHTFCLRTRPILPDQPMQVEDVIKAADIIVVDEISMCRFDIFSYVCKQIRKAEQISGRPKQVIVVGDFYQLPPVLTDDDREVLEMVWRKKIPDIGAGYAFVSPEWDDMHFDGIILDTLMRQKKDTDFARHLNQIRTGDYTAIDWINNNTAKDVRPGIYMYGTNRMVDDKNKAEIMSLGAKRHVYKGVNAGFTKPLPTDVDLVLCVGARVMTIVNDTSKSQLYQNGSLGTVVDMRDKSVVVALDNGNTVEIEPYSWQDFDYRVKKDRMGEDKIVEHLIGEYTQLPLKIAFACTIHKSQSQTFDSANLDPCCFGPGQLYVALSRVTCATDLHLLHPIRKRDLIVSPDVIDFYANL